MVVAHVTPMGRLEIVGSSPAPSWSGPELPVFDIWSPPSGAPRGHVSPSSIETFAGCGLKYRFNYREQLFARPMWAGVGGTALHEVIETVEKAWFAGTAFDPTAPAQQYEAATSELFKTAFRKAIDQQSANPSTGAYADPGTWYAAKQGAEGEAWWWDKGEEMARRYLHTRRDWHDKGWRLLAKPDGNPATEVDFEVPVAGVLLKGRIDDAWYNVDTGDLHIRDPKSKDRKPESNFQLQAYGTAMRALGALGDRKVTASYLMLRKGEHTAPVTLTPADDKVVAYRAQATAAADHAGVFLPNPSSFCVACPFKKQCPAAS